MDVVNDLLGFALGSVYVGKVMDDEALGEVKPNLIYLDHISVLTKLISRSRKWLPI